MLTALVALGPLSTDLYLPSPPGTTRSFAAPVAEIQLTLSVFLVGLLHDGTARPMAGAIALAALLIPLVHQLLVSPGRAAAPPA